MSSARNGGGRASDGIGARYQTEAPLVYQCGSEKLTGRETLSALARKLRKYARTPRERDRCDSIIRKASLSFDGFDLLCELAARSEQPGALEECVRAIVLSRVASPFFCPREASHREEGTNGPLNQAQHLAHEEGSVVRWVQVAELATEQYIATRILIDAAWRAARKSA